MNLRLGPAAAGLLVLLGLGIAMPARATTTHPGQVGVAYRAPAVGWRYVYDGSQARFGSNAPGTFDALDGTWSHANLSDSWDGSTIGGELSATNRPGGVESLVEPDAAYLRLQDTGDPRFAFEGEPSNRKLYFAHNLTAEGASATILDDGVTLSFRARLATTGPLDDRFQGTQTPWSGDDEDDDKPFAGNGYVLHDGGKGIVGVRQAAGGIISFGLASLNEDHAAAQPGAGLVINDANGLVPSHNVDQQDNDHGTLNVAPLVDATIWHEFWINILADPTEPRTGTHAVLVYVDGQPGSYQFFVTAGQGFDYTGISYLALGLGSTLQAGAVDIDHVAWTPGFHHPESIAIPGDATQDHLVRRDDVVRLARFLGTAEFSTPASADFNFDGRTDLADVATLQRVLPPPGATVAVPESAAGWLSTACLTATIITWRLRGAP